MQKHSDARISSTCNDRSARDRREDTAGDTTLVFRIEEMYRRDIVVRSSGPVAATDDPRRKMVKVWPSWAGFQDGKAPDPPENLLPSFTVPPPYAADARPARL